MYDRDIFFDEVRGRLFSGALTQEQVDGQSVILAVWEHQAGGTPMDDERWLAYMLSTTYWETGQHMWPNEELGSASYLQGKEYYPYYGRGFVHLTWEDNYRYASTTLSLVDDRDLVEHPEMARDSLIATRIMFRGMAEGWFTGRKLGEYFNDTTDDPVNARQIINGNDQDIKIAGFHADFLTALQLSTLASSTASKVVFANIQAPPNVEVMVHVNGVEYGQ